VSVRDVVEAALTALESEAALRQVKLHRSVDPNLYVTANKIRLEQVLVNLIDNAVKFNRPGGEVWIEAEPANGQVRISVSDSGIGIPSAELPRVFERFYRVDKARSRQVGGTGLGLSIVKHAVERMGGTVSAESQLGKGSKFTVTLPAG
jgi:two-component system phosphate regulon sensor histidine kinase PhoR